MSTSFKLTPIAQRKNRLVTRTNGNMNFRSVSGAAVEVMFFSPIVSIRCFYQREAVAPARCTAAAKADFLQLLYRRPEGLLHPLAPPTRSAELSGQCPVEMYVSAVHEPVLAGDVCSLPREQENCDAGDFSRFRHSCIKRNLGKDLLQLFFGIGK